MTVKLHICERSSIVKRALQVRSSMFEFVNYDAFYAQIVTSENCNSSSAKLLCVVPYFC